MEKIINQPLSVDGAVLSEPICGGVQGENRATAVEFTPDTELCGVINEYKTNGYSVIFKIDAVTAAGELVGSEERCGEELFSPFYLTERITCSGLDTVIVARIFVSREEIKEICKAQIRLYFISSPIALNSTYKNKNQADRLKEKAEKLLLEFSDAAEQTEARIDKKATQVKSSAETVARHLKQVQDIAEKNEQTLIDFSEGVTFVFSGGDAANREVTGISVDGELSETSKNPLQNGVVTRELNAVKGKVLNNEQRLDAAEEELSGLKETHSGDLAALRQEVAEQNAITQEEILPLKADYITETGTVGAWHYRKWNSGVAECWAKFEGEVKISTLWSNQSVMFYGLIGSFSYPFAFIQKPIVSVDLDAQDSWCNKYSSTATETGNIYAVGAVNKTEAYTLNIMAKGRWK